MNRPIEEFKRPVGIAGKNVVHPVDLISQDRLRSMTMKLTETK
jgi:hypothetical protein